jgi:hypothetical protein
VDGWYGAKKILAHIGADRANCDRYRMEGWQSLVECTGLENQRTFTRTVGSNPTPSAPRANAERSEA